MAKPIGDRSGEELLATAKAEQEEEDEQEVQVKTKPPNRQARNVFNRHNLTGGAKHNKKKPVAVEGESCKARTVLEEKLARLEAAEDPDLDYIAFVKSEIENLQN